MGRPFGDEVNYDIDYETDDDENNHFIRCKWQMDGATTLDEAIELMYNFIDYLKHLKNEGWELTSPVEDDYGFIQKFERRLHT